jgi:hypothetical protein
VEWALQDGEEGNLRGIKNFDGASLSAQVAQASSYFDASRNAFEPILFCPGYLRGRFISTLPSWGSLF